MYVLLALRNAQRGLHKPLKDEAVGADKFGENLNGITLLDEKYRAIWVEEHGFYLVQFWNSHKNLGG